MEEKGISQTKKEEERVM